MRRTLTTIRCVPRFGYEGTEVRTIDVETIDDIRPEELTRALNEWFARKGVADAVFAVDYDDDGIFAIVNDEAYAAVWGKSLL